MNEPLTILLTNDSEIYGGGEFFVYTLAKALTKRGHEVKVACKPSSLLFEKCSRDNLQTIAVDFPAQGKLLHHILLLKKLLQQNTIQVLHTNTNYDRTAGAFAARLAGVAHVANVHSFHSLQHNLTHWIRNRIAVDRFIVDGYCVKEVLVNEDKISPKKISVVYLGVEPETMNNNSLLREKVRREFGLTNEHIVIGNVGRLVPFKGQEYLVEAFARLAQQIPTLRLLLVGEGELRQTLETKTHRLNIQDKVIFAGFRDDLPALYSSFDVYVHSSVEGGGETFPFAVLQALAHELPLVVTNVGDVPAMVEEGKNGYVVADRDASLLAEKMQRIVMNQERKILFGKRSREILLERFTLDTMVNTIETIYREVIKERTSNA
jgi:glycosyltransferase involved in cell wall biosynthesis